MLTIVQKQLPSHYKYGQELQLAFNEDHKDGRVGKCGATKMQKCERDIIQIKG